MTEPILSSNPCSSQERYRVIILIPRSSESVRAVRLKKSGSKIRCLSKLGVKSSLVMVY